VIYHRVLKLKVEETAVLAEIFMLRLETRSRDVNDADQAKTPPFVPFPVGFELPQRHQRRRLKLTTVRSWPIAD
jgi:hypothetical protein